MILSIMKHVAERTHIPTLQLYKQIGWPLYAKYPHAYDAFKVFLFGEVTLRKL